MIVEEPPYDLIFLFADQDAEKLFITLLERGQERGCLRNLRVRSLRDTRKDSMSLDPTRYLSPFFSYENCKFLIAWDNHGSGREKLEFETIRNKVADSFAARGISKENVGVAIFYPELEHVFVPLWERVKQIISNKRNTTPPPDSDILRRSAKLSLAVKRANITDFDTLLDHYPKEAFDALVSLVNLRHSSQLYADIAKDISLRTLKKDETVRFIDEFLQTHFPSAKKIL